MKDLTNNSEKTGLNIKIQVHQYTLNAYKILIFLICLLREGLTNFLLVYK